MKAPLTLISALYKSYLSHHRIQLVLVHLNLIILWAINCKINLNQISTLSGLEAIQVRILDSIRPLTWILAAATTIKNKIEVLRADAVLEALNYLLVFNGNVNSQASFQLQRSVLPKTKASLIELFPKDILTDNTGELFGIQIWRAMKGTQETKKEFCLIERPLRQPSKQPSSCRR